MNQLPSEPVDLLPILTQIEVDCQAIVFMQLQARLRAYTAAVSARDGNSYQKWQHLPVKALNNLAAKLRKELEAMPPEKGKLLPPLPESAIAPSGDVSKSDEFF